MRLRTDGGSFMKGNGLVRVGASVTGVRLVKTTCESS